MRFFYIVASTTNMSHSLPEFVKRVSPARVINVTASFHPMENGTRMHPMNPEIFVGRCLLLQNHGFHVTFNVVVWPPQLRGHCGTSDDPRKIAQSG
jgi:hypothetical protein